MYFDPTSEEIKINATTFAGHLLYNNNEILSELTSVLHEILSIYNFDAGAVYLENATNSGLYELRHSIGFPQLYTDKIKTIRFGKGFSGTAAALRAVRISEDTSNDPRFLRTNLQEQGFRSFISVPLIAGEDVLGILEFASRAKIRFSTDKIEMFYLLGQRLGIYIRERNIISEVMNRERLTRRLYLLGSEAFNIDNLSSICLVTMEECRVLLNLDSAFIILKQANDIYSTGLISNDINPQLIDELFFNLINKEYFLIDKSSLHSSILLDFMGKNGLEFLCFINLSVGDKPFGILGVGQSKNKYKKVDVLSCTQIGRQLSIALSKYVYIKDSKELAVLQEHNRIYHGLHDSIAQQLGAVVNKLEFIERSIGHNESSQQVLLQIAKVKELMYLSMTDVRESISSLRLIKPGGNDSLAVLIHKYVKLFKQYSGIDEIIVDTINFDIPIPVTIKIQLFRIIQEALSNIRKHSKATKVSIEPKLTENILRILISDNGIGFDINKIKSSNCGLATMHERAEEIGAKCEISSVLGQGTIVSISINQYLFETEV